MKHLGDITQINGYTATPVNVIIGGSPCQDLSVAGKRAGLQGERSGLFMEQIRIIKEMRDNDERQGRTGADIRPRYMVWENVPGAFSSNKGADFGAVLQETVKVIEPKAPAIPVPQKGWPTAGCLTGDDMGRKWSVAWRVFDAQFWGVPQRRRRIALVADFGGFTAPEILFECESLQRNTDPCGTSWKAAPSPADSAGRGSGGYIRCAERLQKGCLLDSGGCVKCDSNFLGGYMDSAKEQKAIERLKAFEPADGYYLAYSGGKDSDCIKILAQLSGVKFDAVHNLTTVDAPETVRYVQSQPDVRIDKSFDKNGNHVTMWNLIVKKLMPPTRIARYCCSKLKERGGIGRVVVTGVRWSESQRRKESADVIKIIGKPKTTMKTADEIGIEYQQTYQGGIILNDDNDKNRRFVEHCYRTTKTMVNPIVDWSDDDVWNFLHYYGCKSNPLYECGFNRIGCIGCPMAGKHRYVEFEQYPKYKQNYITAFDRMLERRRQLGKAAKFSWQTGQDVFRWWLGEDFNQITFDDLEE